MIIVGSVTTEVMRERRRLIAYVRRRDPANTEQLNSRELTKSTELQDSDSDIENIRMLPAIILHADRSSNPKKRWMCTATLDGEVYRLEAPIQVEATASLVRRAVQLAKDGGSALGFDFPIGVPKAYARLAGIDRFLSHLPELGSGPWREFFNIARQPTEVSIRRPFYPARPGGTLQQHLVAGIGVRSVDDLLRRCDFGNGDRNNACALFWTLGGNQVGRAALAGWREVLVPAMHTLRDSWAFGRSRARFRHCSNPKQR